MTQTRSSAAEIDVILCTYNPRPDLLARALRALSAQTLPLERFNVTVVDNNSDAPLDAARLSAVACRPVRVVREMRQGLAFARAGGIDATAADIICFVDDDNELAATYLSSALRIARAEPELGAFGGVCEGRLERAPNLLVRAFLPHYGVRDMARAPLTGAGAAWGPHEPIGAGLVIRRDVARAYLRFIDDTDMGSSLGRIGGDLLSGEDSLISRIADKLGYQGGYRPQLHLKHNIVAPRLTLAYLRKLLVGHGKSHVTLEALCGRLPDPVARERRTRHIVGNALHRLRVEGPRTALGMIFWDMGFVEQARDMHAGAPAPEMSDGVGVVGRLFG